VAGIIFACLVVVRLGSEITVFGQNVRGKLLKSVDESPFVCVPVCSIEDVFFLTHR